jgi:hypothetical protein
VWGEDVVSTSGELGISAFGKVEERGEYQISVERILLNNGAAYENQTNARCRQD